MTRVSDQRRYDDCLRACASMVLDVPYEETPDVEPEAVTNKEFWNTWIGWTEARGLSMRFCYDDAPVDHGQRWIAVVDSQTMPGKDHVVVMWKTRLVHDPARGEAKRTYVSASDVKYAICFQSLTELPQDKPQERKP